MASPDENGPPSGRIRRGVVTTTLGITVFIAVALYALARRRAPSAGPVVTLAAVVTAVASMLWITQNLSRRAADWLDDRLHGLFPRAERAAIIVAASSGLTAYVVGGFEVQRRFMTWLSGVESPWTAVIIGLLSQLVAALLLGTTLTFALVAGLRLLKRDSPSTPPLVSSVGSWLRIWLWVVFFSAIALSRDVGIAVIVALALAAGAVPVTYFLIKLSSWVVLSPVRGGFLIAEAAQGSSPSLGLVWVLSCMAMALAVFALIREF